MRQHGKYDIGQRTKNNGHGPAVRKIKGNGGKAAVSESCYEF